MHINIQNIQQNNLEEISQTTYMLFALLKKVDKRRYINVTPLMRCRDYFNDIIYIQYNKSTDFKKTYGFTWEYQPWLAKQVKNNKYTNMLILVKDNIKLIRENINIINNLEARLGFALTKFKEVKYDIDMGGYTDCHALFVKIPLKWWANSPLFSLYTLLWRLIGGYEDINKYDNIEEILKAIADSSLGTSEEGLVTEINANLDHFTYFVDNWEAFVGYSAQPYTEEDITDDEDDEELNEEIHNGSGIQSMVLGMSSPKHAEPAIRKWCLKYEEMHNG